MFQLSFLNTGLLAFTAATILPLLIWLLAKKKPRQVLFSSLRFIKLSQQQEKNRTKLTNIILLIIRMLIILLIALAISRPMLSSDSFGKSQTHPPTAIAIILDTSYSMDYVEDSKNLLEKSTEIIQKIGTKATSADRLVLITRDESWNMLHAQIFAGAIPEEVLSAISISWQPMPWEDVYLLAERKLAEAQMPNKEIYLISDMMNEDIAFKSQHPVFGIPITKTEERQNVSISEARILPQIVGRSRQQTIQFKAGNHGNADRNETLVKVVVDDVKVAERFINIPARQTISTNITFEIRQEGWQSGYVEVLDEYLEADNRSYFAYEYYQNPAVAVVSSSGIPPYLNSVLTVFGGGKAPQLISPSALNLQSIDSYNLLVFHDFGALTPRLREIFAALKEREKGALFTTNKNLMADAKSYLEQSFKIKLTKYNPATKNVDYISPHHSVSAIVAGKKLKNNSVTGFWESTGATNSIISAGSFPLAIANENAALWLWDINSSSAFFLDPSFAVYAYRQLNALQSVNTPVTELKVGDSIRANALKLPSGDLLNLTNPSYRTYIPGLYTINPDSPKAASIAVNMNYYDSEATATKPKTKIKMLSADYLPQVFSSRLGRDLWKILLIMALALVLTEIIIVKIQEAKAGR